MKRHPRAACAFIPILFLIVTGCSKDSGTNPDTSPDIRFPLAVGNSWEYDLHAIESVIYPEDDTTTVDWDIDVTMEIEDVEHVFEIQAYRMKITHAVTSGPDSGAVHSGYTWLAETDSSLVGVATKHSTMFWPVTAQIMKPVAITDETEPNEWGNTILIYPLNTGTTWAATQDFDGYVSKQALGHEKLTVNDQDINTCMVRINWDFGKIPSMNPASIVSTMDQWYAAIGLVKQTNYIISVIPEDDDYYPAGTTIITEYTMTLVDYHIQE